MTSPSGVTGVRSMARSAVMVSAVLLAAASCGCSPPRTPYPESFTSPRPEERLAAIKQAGDTRDTEVLDLLVDRLEDEDDGIRFYAIGSLERITGTRLGYVYYQPERQRWWAVQRWRRYLQRIEEGDSPQQASQAAMETGPGSHLSQGVK